MSQESSGFQEQAAPAANIADPEEAVSTAVPGENVDTPAAPQKKGRSRKTTTEKTSATKKPRKPRANLVVPENGDESAASTQQSERPKKRRRKKEPSPEGEDIEIDPETLTMFELARASKRGSQGGKTSKLERAMENIDWDDVAKKRKEKEVEERAAGIKDSEKGANERLDRAGDESQRGPQLKLVNGQMVLDNSSLFVNRHGEAPEGDDMDELEEDDLTTRINSQSWMYDNKKDPVERFRSSHKSDPWGEADTDKFYDALSMWGTDFQIMAAMFPGKTRRHIKLKFVREEKADPDRVHRALVHDVVPMNLGTFCAATGQDEGFYKDPQALNEELRIEEEQQRAEIQKQQEDAAEAQKKKQEDAAAKLGKKKSRRKKNEGMGGAGGEEVEVDLGDLADIPF